MSIFEYVIDNSPSASDDQIIRNGIVNFNSQTINEKATHFSVFAKDGNQIIGGALIWEHSDALYIDVLWCNENYRKKRIGTKIISMIDDIQTICRYLCFSSTSFLSKAWLLLYRNNTRILIGVR